MAKYNSRDAFNSRICELAQTGKSTQKESRNIGTLIDIKRDSDGIAYGIIKENHNYYVKKGSTKQNLTAADFSYIGGLENIKTHQYKTIVEAERQRNVMFSFINESKKLVINKSGTKLIIKEGAGEEIDAAASSVPDLDNATAAKEASSQNPVVPDLTDTQPIPDGSEAAPVDDLPVDGGAEAPVDDLPVDGAEAPVDGNGEAPIDGEVSEDNKEIQKMVGKVTEKIRNAQMTTPEVKSFINSFLAAFQEKLPEVEIEDRKEMANKILKVVDQGEIDSLENSMPADEIEEGDSEPSSFTEYAETRGYDKDSFASASDDEKTSVISGFVTAHGDGKNDGDAKTVALYADDKMAEALDKEYGHNKYVSEILKPEMMKMSEGTEEDKQLKINELSWGGLKNVGNAIGGAAKKGLTNLGNAADKVVTGVENGVKNAATSVANTAKAGYDAAATGIKNAGTEIKNQYNTGVRDDRVAELNKLGQELKTKIDALNAASAKVGGKQIDLNQALDLIKKQLGGVPENIKNNAGATKAYNLGKNNTVQGAVAENTVDAGNTQVKEMLHEDDEENELESEPEIDDLEMGEPDESSPIGSDPIVTDEPEVEAEPMGFAPAAQSLGMMGTATGSTSTGGTEVTVDGNNKTVSVTMNEAEQKLRKYIRTRLEIKTGKRKENLNESPKSEKMKQLDKLIDAQYSGFNKKK